MTIRIRFTAVALALAAFGSLTDAAADCRAPQKTRFFVPPPNPGAVKQIKDLAKAHKLKEAFAVASLALQPHAVWLVGGTPSEVEAQVRETVRAARLTRTTPVFVAYNLPF